MVIGNAYNLSTFGYSRFQTIHVNFNPTRQQQLFYTCSRVLLVLTCKVKTHTTYKALLDTHRSRWHYGDVSHHPHFRPTVAAPGLFINAEPGSLANGESNHYLCRSTERQAQPLTDRRPVFVSRETQPHTHTHTNTHNDVYSGPNGRCRSANDSSQCGHTARPQTRVQ